MHHLPHNTPSPYVYAPYGPLPMGYAYPGHQPAAFQHVFQANYQGTQPPAPLHQEPAAFRVALADTTSAVVNWTTPQTTQPQPATKRKRSQAGGGRPSKRANTGTTTASTSTLTPAQAAQGPSPSTPVIIPVIHGVGPQSATLPPPSNNTSSPPATRKPGPSSSRGSLLTSSSRKNNAGATDVWYFVRGLKERKAHEPIPFPTSYFRPDSKEFPFLGCTLCQYVLVDSD